MRLYSFVNMYLSGPHIGIQTAHAVAELFLKYPDEPDVRDWAKNHKTIICLNGGDVASLIETRAILANTEYAYADFYEPRLNDCLTTVATVLPEVIYETAKTFREDGITKFDLNQSILNKDELALIDFINTCALAK